MKMKRLSPVGGLQELRPDVARLLLVMVNVYIIGQRQGPWVLVDAGLHGTAGTIARVAEERQGRPPEAIILTHGHFDHVGALKELIERWQVPIYAHPLELPYLTGLSAYPPPDPGVSMGAMALSSPLYPAGPFDFRPHVHPLPEDGHLPGAPGWRWLPTPGHSPGHVSLWREADRTLIVGDAFVTTAQESVFSALTQFPTEVRRPPAYFTPDWNAARESVVQLEALQPDLAATGHGTPMWNELLRQELRVLARNFDTLARPRNGRYTLEGATADERGVQSVPPLPAADPNSGMKVGIALGALALGALFTLRR
ncbi:MBL fold metallo-hydrolase [Deinococcus peraridilitoris]|uniref:Zn-dependent hydrolase, glyoxylase n=1 Tax=Deinococcus peraridilitoris (strain DSM 19664 / LMG 22246 / CIP 109416 / KR-200) TaxID=937777 RepID=K9ZZX1_DEIPD|nr:MBL fold metallo-hydrolase [Deinococcus peraridilitoris]AFZ66320.1 Zn-dependent hydrolase, glyoxylase [Deinococcus peraridilitoris DSM 19664]